METEKKLGSRKEKQTFLRQEVEKIIFLMADWFMIKRTFDHVRPAVEQVRYRERGGAHSAPPLHHRSRFVP